MTSAPRLIVHIGMPKTGTSLIQAVLSMTRDHLLEQRVWVPPSNIAAHRLAVEAIHQESLLHERSDVVAIREAMRLDEAIELCAGRESSPDTAILSSEYFSEGDPQLLRGILTAASLDPQNAFVVACLRRQDRLLVSGFNQDVKALHRTAPLQWSAPPANSSDRLDWFRALAPWAEVFGKEAIRVQVFERATSSGQSLTGQFLSLCDIAHEPTVVSEQERRQRPHENASLSADLLAFKFIANSITAPGELQWMLEDLHERGVGTGTFGLDERTTRQIIDHYAPSNRRVASEYLSESNELFDSEVRAGTRSELVPSPEFLAQAIAVLGARMGDRDTG